MWYLIPFVVVASAITLMLIFGGSSDRKTPKMSLGESPADSAVNITLPVRPVVHYYRPTRTAAKHHYWQQHAQLQASRKPQRQAKKENRRLLRQMA